MYAIRSYYVLHRVFIRKRAVELKVPLVNLYVFGPLVLSVLSLLLGVWPDALTIFLEPALEVVRAGEVAFKLQVWHGFNLVFVTSFFTVLGGAVLAWVLIISKTFMAEWRKFNRQFFTINLTDVFFTTFTQVISYAVTHTKRIQHGYNRYYIMSILLFTTLMIGIQLFLQTGWELPKQVSFQPFVLTGIIGVTAIATLVTSVSQTRINAIIAMGVLGYGISLIYLYYSAVDLAITQIIVETLTLIMFVIVLKKLPEFSSYSKKIPILRDVFIALCFGGVMTLLALKALDVELSHPISDYFIQNSYLKA